MIKNKPNGPSGKGPNFQKGPLSKRLEVATNPTRMIPGSSSLIMVRGSAARSSDARAPPACSRLVAAPWSGQQEWDEELWDGSVEEEEEEQGGADVEEEEEEQGGVDSDPYCVEDSMQTRVMRSCVQTKMAAGCVTEDVGSTAASHTAGTARRGFQFVFAQIRAFRCGGCGGCQW